jgi:hypothetical protein
MDYLARIGGADVVFVGTSLVNGAADAFVAARGVGGGHGAYNAALSAGLPLIMEPWTTDVVLPRLRPKLLVLGLSSMDFADSAAARTFEAALEDSPAGGQALGTESVLEKLDRWVTDRSDLWRHRFALREPRTVLNAIRGRAKTPSGEYGPVRPGGRTAYPQRRAGGPVGLGPPVQGWRLGRESPAAIRRLIRLAKAREVKVVLVDMPITQTYVDRHPQGERDFRRYVRALRELARSEQVRLLEYSSTRAAHLFVDQVHLRTAAGDAFTERLARQLRAELRTGSR